jgi:hypothetical protein
VAQDIDQKLRVTMARIGAVTLKDLVAAFVGSTRQRRSLSIARTSG